MLYKINRYLGVIYLLQNSFNISIFLTLRSITDDCVSIPICVFFLLISFIPDLRLFLAIFFYSLFFNRVSNGLRHIAEEKNAFFFSSFVNSYHHFYTGSKKRIGQLAYAYFFYIRQYNVDCQKKKIKEKERPGSHPVATCLFQNSC